MSAGPSCPLGDSTSCPYINAVGDTLCTSPNVASLDAYRRKRADTSRVMCVGVSFRTAPIEVRERLTLSPYATSATLARVGCQHVKEPGSLDELAIVATCNRLEFYAASVTAPIETLSALFREATGMTEGDAERYLYRYVDGEAVEHLSRVAAGLESMVLGEPQILGQVSEAFSHAIAHGSCHAVLSTVFRSAIKAGRRARVETAINRSPATVSSVAVKLASEAIPALEKATVVVVGAGEMAELAAIALTQRGVTDVRIVSRTREHAAALADRVKGKTLAFEELEKALTEADIVISSTAAPHVIITRDMVQYAMRGRESRPLFLIDIALPRDVDPAAASVPNVAVHDIDGLQRHVESNIAERELEIPSVERIVQEETLVCEQALQQLGVAPLISDLRMHADEIRQRTLETALKGLGHLSEKDRRRIEAFSEALLNKLLHEPTSRLRNEAGTGRAAEYASTVRDLFGLASKKVAS
jgi:glutamyl-tRNA reductase